MQSFDMRDGMPEELRDKISCIFAFSMTYDGYLVVAMPGTIAVLYKKAGSPINPEPVPGGVATGMSDFVHMTLFTPKSSGRFTWGIGGMLSVPIATDDALGSGKWDLGPAARITYRGDFWTIGAVAGQRWSFAGSSSRADVSLLMLRGTFRRSLGSGWFFVSAPIVSANWNSSSSNRWLVPVGGGIGKTLQVGHRESAVSAQAYTNIIKPDGAPDWSLRFALVAAVPKQWFKRRD